MKETSHVGKKPQEYSIIKSNNFIEKLGYFRPVLVILIYGNRPSSISEF